jgi:hypothetical protein
MRVNKDKNKQTKNYANISLLSGSTAPTTSNRQLNQGNDIPKAQKGR